MINYFACIGLCTIILLSCNSNKPQNLLPPKKMQAVFLDIIKVDSYSKDFISKDSSKNAAFENAKMQMQVFALHNVTKESFYDSYKYYTSKSDLMQPFFDSAINKATVERYVSPISKQNSNAAEQQ